MNMKVMNRLAVGTLFATATALSMTGCGNSGHKNVDRVLEKDTVEFTTNPQEEINEEPVSKAEEISYEHNIGLDRRMGYNNRGDKAEIARNYKSMGTYGATLYYGADDVINMTWVAILDYASPMHDKIIKKALDWNIRCEDIEGYDEWKYYSDMSAECLREGVAHKEELQAEIEEKLFSEGTPTATQCMTYLTRKLAGMDYVSNEDYDKVQKDVERYKKEQGPETTQTKAELMRYMQFKIENLYQKNMLESRDLLKNITIRKKFEEYTKSGDDVFWEHIHPEYTYE